MPLRVEGANAAPVPLLTRERRLRRGVIGDRGRSLRIGLVNNMPDAAFSTAERQFRTLIEDAADAFDVNLTLYALDTLPRDPAVRAAIAGAYRSPRRLRSCAPDAMLFTGAEPLAIHLADEPYWDELTALIDASRGHVISALYSCLAAHAAVFHLDRAPRRRLPQKLSGLYESEIVASHELTRGLSAMLTPHSRWNTIPEADLAARGYLILTRSPDAGADMFVREREGLDVFWQGHPEYDRDTLAREFRRDLLRFLKGAVRQPPQLPRSYFEQDAIERIDAALAPGASASLDDIAAALSPEALSPATAIWRDAARILMRNWLTAVAGRKSRAGREDRRIARRHGG